jgi:hypothetical protein
VKKLQLLKQKNLQRRGLEKKYLRKYKAINMNYGNEDTRYFGGIPSSIISYSSDRGRYQAYDGIYDLTTTTTYQLTTLQNQITSLQKELSDVKNTRVAQILSTSRNLIANGDCSQWSMVTPITGSCNAGVNNNGFMIQGRVTPIMDRWYNVCELAGVNPQYLKFECTQVKITDYIVGTEAYEAAPRICSYGMKLKWYNSLGTTADIFTMEHTKIVRNVDKFGAIMAVQHTVPDVTLTVNQNYSLGFWLYTTYTGAGMIRVLRQYNVTSGGANALTSDSLEHLYITSFNFVSGWNYISTNFITTTLKGGMTIGGLGVPTGLVIQIGHFYYNWLNTNPIKSELFGSIPTGRSSYEWVLSEIQLRSGDITSKTNFTINLREYESTMPYICSTSVGSVLAHPSARITNRVITGSFTHTYTISFNALIEFPVRMKEYPTLIIYNTNMTNKIGAIYVKGDPSNVYNTTDAVRPMFNGASFTGLVNGYDCLRHYSAFTNRVDTEPISSDLFTPSSSVGVYYISDKNFELRFTRNYSFDAATISTLLVENAYLKSDPAYNSRFVMLVYENHIGKWDQSETISYVDYTYSAITSRPFPITI